MVSLLSFCFLLFFKFIIIIIKKFIDFITKSRRSILLNKYNIANKNRKSLHPRTLLSYCSGSHGFSTLARERLGRGGWESPLQSIFCHAGEGHEGPSAGDYYLSGGDDPYESHICGSGGPPLLKQFLVQ